jgi:hypothetical protein
MNDATFNEAFPELKEFTLHIREEDQFGWEKPYTERLFNLRTPPPPHFPCSNPFCERGGLSLEGIILDIVFNKTTNFEKRIKCPGDHGSPQGRRKGKSCHHTLLITISAEYGDDVS